MARLNANAHSLGSLSGLDQQPMQYHIVFKRLFVLPYICHIVCLFVLPKLYFFYICHTFFPLVLLPKSIIQNEIMLGKTFLSKRTFLLWLCWYMPQRARISAGWTFSLWLCIFLSLFLFLFVYFSLIVLIYAPACKDIC